MPFVCHTCGKPHDELPLTFGADAPYWYDVIAPEERERRALLSSDQCVIDDKHFFIRACLELPILGLAEVFTWGVWGSLSKANFDRVCEVWNEPGRVNEPPYFSWLSTRLPLYPDTMNLQGRLHTRDVGVRPLLFLEPSDHPLSAEQRFGVSMSRVHEIASILLHEGGA